MSEQRELFADSTDDRDYVCGCGFCGTIDDYESLGMSLEAEDCEPGSDSDWYCPRCGNVITEAERGRQEP